MDEQRNVVPAARRDDPGAGQLVPIVVRQLKKPKVIGGLGLWMFGLFAMLLAPAPVEVSPETLAEYRHAMSEADALHLDDIMRAQNDYIEATLEVEAEKVWFWRFKSGPRARVYERMEVQGHARRILDAEVAKREKKVVRARQMLGVWSDYGVEETRDQFWGTFESGKVFAKRQSFWDLIFSATSRNDDGLMGRLIQWAFQALINFTIGLLGSLFVFMFRLPSILASFGASWLSSAAFFFVAMLAAISTVTAYLGAMYGTAATGMYMIRKGAQMQRLEGGPGGRRPPPRHIPYQAYPRPHHE